MKTASLSQRFLVILLGLALFTPFIVPKNAMGGVISPASYADCSGGANNCNTGT